jgi:hypothetical protein
MYTHDLIYLEGLLLGGLQPTETELYSVNRVDIKLNNTHGRRAVHLFLVYGTLLADSMLRMYVRKLLFLFSTKNLILQFYDCQVCLLRREKT